MTFMSIKSSLVWHGTHVPPSQDDHWLVGQVQIIHSLLPFRVAHHGDAKVRPTIVSYNGQTS